MTFLGSFKKMFGSKVGDERSILEKKVRSAPNDPQLRQKLALILLKQREVIEGVTELAKAAELYEKDGFAGKAIAVLRQLLKYDIENVEVQQRLVGLLARQGLTGDAQAEFEKFSGRLAGKLTDEKKIDFFNRIAESLPHTPMPHLYVVDVLLPQHKLYEVVSALEKSVESAVAAGETLRYSERLSALIAAAGDSVDHLEPCGFLSYRVGNAEQGLSLFKQIRESTSTAGDAGRLLVIDRVMDAIADGWDVAAAKVIGFSEAAQKLSESPKEPSTDAVPIQPPVPDILGEEEAQLEAEEDASMVQDALGRLQAKVDEEIGESDLDTRYNLGIAYKEMGLLDEALKEFRIAARKAELRLGATTLLADVMADQGNVDAALSELDSLIGSVEIDASGARDVRYHKAILLEKVGRGDEAADIFEAILVESPGYRDVRARAERLGR